MKSKTNPIKVKSSRHYICVTFNNKFFKDIQLPVARIYDWRKVSTGNLIVTYSSKKLGNEGSIIEITLPKLISKKVERLLEKKLPFLSDYQTNKTIMQLNLFNKGNT